MLATVDPPPPSHTHYIMGESGDKKHIWTVKQQSIHTL